MTHLIYENKAIMFFEPSTGVYVPVECNAWYLDGDWKDSVVIDAEQAKRIVEECLKV